MEITIRCFGKAKELEKSGRLSLAFAQPVSVSTLRRALIEKLSSHQDPQFVEALVNDCALGDSQKILHGDQLLSGDQSLVLLPPVCGG